MEVKIKHGKHSKIKWSWKLGGIKILIFSSKKKGRSNLELKIRVKCFLVVKFKIFTYMYYETNSNAT